MPIVGLLWLLGARRCTYMQLQNLLDWVDSQPLIETQCVHQLFHQQYVRRLTQQFYVATVPVLSHMAQAPRNTYNIRTVFLVYCISPDHEDCQNPRVRYTYVVRR